MLRSVAAALTLALLCIRPAPSLAKSATPWWQTAVIYQIYPRSFQDSNGDGIGDLQGVMQRVGYLKELGVDAVWLSPVYKSPMRDFGYDVSDYQAIDPMFGTMADFEQLIKTLHGQGIKLIMDLVANHTSEEHPWFVEARASKTNPKRDWYVWHDMAPGGQPPNNWRGVFAGSAWTLDAATNQAYYHAFLPSQPDLNWRNPAVRQAMQQVMRFWLDKGVDGFRLDAIGQLVEDAQLRDEQPNPKATAKSQDYEHWQHEHTVDQPETHTYLRELRQVVDAYPGDRVLISENYLEIPTMMTYYGKASAPEAQLPFNFYLIGAPWDARSIAAYMKAYEAALPPQAWPNWVLSNHDRSRLATRLGADRAKLAALLLLTLRGTPTLYYGDELGMTDTVIPPDQVQDPFEQRDPGKGAGRDPERTPMAWDQSPLAGFTTGRPWLPLGTNAKAHNVVTEKAAPDSTLRFYQRLIALRRSHPSLARGDYQTVAATAETLIYTRQAGADRVLVALNFSAHPQPLTTLPKGYKQLLSSLTDRPPLDPQRPLLLPNEGLLLHLKK